MSSIRSILKALLILCALYSNDTYSQSFEELSPLDMGRVAVIRNDTVGNLSVDRFDRVSHSNHFRVIIPGKAAVYQLSGAAARTGYFFSAVARQTVFPINPGVETFTIESLSYDDYQVTDANGSLLFKLGANIETSGNGRLLFATEPYTVLVDVTFSL